MAHWPCEGPGEDWDYTDPVQDWVCPHGLPYAYDAVMDEWVRYNPYALPVPPELLERARARAEKFRDLFD